MPANHANPVLHQDSGVIFLHLVSPESEFPFKYHQSRTMATFSLLGHVAQMPLEMWPILFCGEFSLDGRNIWKP